MIKLKEDKFFVIVFVGFNGFGKIIIIVKFVYWFKKNGFSVVIVVSDIFRVGVIE